MRRRIKEEEREEKEKEEEEEEVGDTLDKDVGSGREGKDEEHSNEEKAFHGIRCHSLRRIQNRADELALQHKCKGG